MLKKSASFVLSRSVSSRTMSTLRGPHSLRPCWTAFLIILCWVVLERAPSNNSYNYAFKRVFQHPARDTEGMGEIAPC